MGGMLVKVHPTRATHAAMWLMTRLDISEAERLEISEEAARALLAYYVEQHFDLDDGRAEFDFTLPVFSGLSMDDRLLFKLTYGGP